MATNSRAKGARGEREWAGYCRDHGYENVRRTVQYCGKTGEASDCIGLPGLHQEVKRVERLNLDEAMEQAVRDSRTEESGLLPIVAHRKNKKEWLVTMRAEDWFRIYGTWVVSYVPPEETE